MPYCRHCGQSVGNNQSFCGRCGAQRLVGPAGDAFGREADARAAYGSVKSVAPVAATASAAGAFGSRLIVILLSFVLISGGAYLYVTQTQERPSDVVVQFVEAANALDFNTMIACLPPEQERAWKAAGNLTAAFIKVNPYDVFELMPALFSGFKTIGGADFDYQMRVLEIVDEQVTGNTARVIVRVEATTVDGSGQTVTEVQDLVANLRKYKEGWRMLPE